MAGRPLRRRARESWQDSGKEPRTRFVRRKSEYEEGFHFVDDSGGSGGAQWLHVQQWNEGGDGDNQPDESDSADNTPDDTTNNATNYSTDYAPDHASAGWNADPCGADKPGADSDSASRDERSHEHDAGYVDVESVDFDADQSSARHSSNNRQRSLHRGDGKLPSGHGRLPDEFWVGDDLESYDEHIQHVCDSELRHVL
jgi:hypothetical protein